MNIPNSFDFPFKPYNIQLNFMKTLYSTLETKKFGIFESPTGTGKSLSIICGSVRWLKDYYDKEKNILKEKIEELTKMKANITSSSNDWLKSQSEEININRQINNLKIEENKIIEYNEKIKKLLTTTNKRKIISMKNEEVSQENPLLESSPEDDCLLNESDDFTYQESDDDEDENKEYKPVKIFISSRTHSQLSQFIGEILRSPFKNNIRVTTLASRQIYCINPNVTCLKSSTLMNDRCLDLQKKTTSSGDNPKKKRKNDECKCPYYRQEAIDELKAQALTEVMDIEDLIKHGKNLKACPYYASRYAAEDAEIVLVPYNTILHQATREANGINLANNVVIIDEAHNLLEAIAQMYKNEINYNQVQIALKQLKLYKQRFNTKFSAKNLLHLNQLIFIVTKLEKFFDTKTTSEILTLENFVSSAEIDNFNMFKLIKFCRESRICQKLRNYSLKYPDEKTKKVGGIKEFLTSIENKNQELLINNNVNKEGQSIIISNPLLAIVSFMESLTYSYDDGRILLQISNEKSQNQLKFLLLNPSTRFTDIIKDARSIIVAGGTMKPINEFKDRLFINSGGEKERIVEFSCGHIIPDENILPIILSKGCKNENLLFNYENRFDMGVSLKEIIQKSCTIVPGGIVVFFPSYKYENWFWQQIKDESFGRPIFREPQGSNMVEMVLKKYADIIKKHPKNGALLFSVIGGKLSEGLNFNDDLGRCIIVVGLPYANIMAPDLKEKMSYLDKKEGSGSGKKFYENLCIKSVNQSIGRAVRHKNDYATILLVDERFNRNSTKNSLPDWMQKSLIISNFNDSFESIKNVYKIHTF